MDERRLQVFRAVAELRNFSRAAEVLHMSQPAVSQQIQALEEHYGVRLLDRTSKAVQLTAAGRALYAQIIPLLQQFAEVQRAVVRAAGSLSGPLTVGASLTIGQYVLPQVLAAFERQHPEVRVRLHIQNTEVVAFRVRDSELDMGFVEGPVTGSDLHEEPFLDDELVLIAPANHHWRERRTIAPSELYSERLIVRERGSGTREVMENGLRAAGINVADLTIATELGGTEAIKGAVEAGMGVAIISQWTLRKELRLGTLLARRLRKHPIKRTFRVIYPHGHTLVPAAAALLDFLRSAEAQGILQG